MMVVQLQTCGSHQHHACHSEQAISAVVRRSSQSRVSRDLPGHSLQSCKLVGPAYATAKVAAQSSSFQEPETCVSRRLSIGLAAALALSSTAGVARAALAPKNQEADPATSPYIQDLLKKTEAMRETRFVQRLRDYDRRNFRDYFAFEAGSLASAKARGINEETYRAIQKWMKDNP